MNIERGKEPGMLKAEEWDLLMDMHFGMYDDQITEFLSRLKSNVGKPLPAPDFWNERLVRHLNQTVLKGSGFRFFEEMRQSKEKLVAYYGIKRFKERDT